MNAAQTEAIAEADAHTSNAALPTYTELLAVMQAAVSQPIMSIRDVNTLVGGNVWWPAGVNDAIVKTLKQALAEQNRRDTERLGTTLARFAGSPLDECYRQRLALAICPELRGLIEGARA